MRKRAKQVKQTRKQGAIGMSATVKSAGSGVVGKDKVAAKTPTLKAAKGPPSSTKKLPCTSPSLMPKEDEELLANNDFVEFHYKQVARVRQRESLTEGQRELLEKHDVVERRIATESGGLLREAYENIDRGTDILLRLIRSQRLLKTYVDCDGNVTEKDDNALLCFLSRLEIMNGQLIRLARIRTPHACRSLWYEALRLAKEVVRLAGSSPEEFRPTAETSLLMPSVRAQNLDYTADAERIVKAIHLAKEHPARGMPKDRSRLGELCGYLVANVLDSIVHERRHYQFEEEHLQRLQTFHGTAEQYQGITIEEFLGMNIYPTLLTRYLQSGSLPEFPDDPKKWWELRIKPTLREEFDRLERHPEFNTALWEELCDATDKGKSGAMWKVLSDNCRNKVNQLARAQNAKSFA